MEFGTPFLRGTTIVLLGDFTPTTFHPEWFARMGVLGEQEAAAAAVDIIHPEICAFRTEWGSLNCTRDRLIVEGAQEPFEVARDFAIGTLTQLSHVPIRMMGINVDSHYEATDISKWHALGHGLAPKAVWKKVFDNPGLLTMTVENPRTGDFPGHTRVKVEPSKKTRSSGVYFGVNCHFDFTTMRDKGNPGADAAIEALSQFWDDSVRDSTNIVHAILEEYPL